jgi:hypothetical protein
MTDELEPCLLVGQALLGDARNKPVAFTAERIRMNNATGPAAEQPQVFLAAHASGSA